MNNVSETEQSDLPITPPAAPRPRTFCNPIDLPYCFREDEPSRREAADPTLILYKGEYWLFASKSEGYWRTRDFVDWKLVVPIGLPVEFYAPTVLEIGEKLYWTACDTGIYETDDPGEGVWRLSSETPNMGDPDLFLDDDGRVYLYSGLDDGGPIGGQEVDPKNGFQPLGDFQPFFGADIANHGGEIRAEPYDTAPFADRRCWIEGAWMTKHDGKYYLQYSAPGTEFKSYNDGVYVSDQPLGPFTFAPYSPFSFKPTGFATGAGHSSTFQDLSGRYWRIVTMTISIRHDFERRLGVFPAWFENDGQMVCNTYLGDYPQFIPGAVEAPTLGNSPGWMLVSYKKPATASSTLEGFSLSSAFDEEIRTWWSAETGDPGEWLQVDLEKSCRIDAIQINFADEGSTQFGRLHDGYGYKLEVSNDGAAWTIIIDRTTDKRDAPHDYIPLDAPILARYARITNTHMPAGAKFSLSGLRLFGSGLGEAPNPVGGVKVIRDAADERQATITWNPVAGADGYIVRYGVAADRLYSSYQVYGTNSLHIHTLNVGVSYFFTVDAFNDSGVTLGDAAIPG